MTDEKLKSINDTRKRIDELESKLANLKKIRDNKCRKYLYIGGSFQSETLYLSQEYIKWLEQYTISVLEGEIHNLQTLFDRA